MYGMVQYVISSRGNLLLEMDGQKFTLNRKKDTTFYWECVKKRNKLLKCNARIVIVDGCVKSIRGIHNHHMPKSDSKPEIDFNLNNENL